MLRRLLDRPVAVTMIAVVLVILGVVSSRLLPVSLVPDIDAPYITVQIPAQGVPARQLNETVVIPLSRQLIQLSQLTDIRSDAREGSAVIRLTFEQGADIDYLFIEVNEKIDRSISSLPRDLERPKVIKASATDTIVTGRTTGAPVRVLKNKMAREYLRMEKQNLPLEEMEKLTLGSLRRAVFDGDVDTGSFMAGQVAGMVREIRPLRQIFEELMTGYENVRKELSE